jgi:hypothetical protein
MPRDRPFTGVAQDEPEFSLAQSCSLSMDTYVIYQSVPSFHEYNGLVLRPFHKRTKREMPQEGVVNGLPRKTKLELCGLSTGYWTFCLLYRGKSTGRLGIICQYSVVRNPIRVAENVQF